MEQKNKTIYSFAGRTKIICTIGPSVKGVKKIVHMIEVGMDFARLNFSHGTYKDHLEYITNIRKAARLTQQHIGILIDLQGPKIRVGKLWVDFIELKKNRLITITTEKSESFDKIPTTYKNLPKDVKTGSKILIDDGKIELKVVKINGSDILCKVINGGFISSNKGINLPGVKVSTPALTEKDKQDILFGLENGVDYFALSFVRSAGDIVDIREFIRTSLTKKIKRTNDTVPIIAKIEKPEAVDDIDRIIETADAIMVARGDLGVEISVDKVPMIQKEIVKKCNIAGKPVIIATQMLESMIAHPNPTRAEVSDVANAVLDGADAIMLSGETSIGRYPVQAVQIMDKINKTSGDIAAQKSVRQISFDSVSMTDLYDALAESAVVLSNGLRSSAIITVTFSGRTAMRVAKFRPKAWVIAVTESEEVARKLSLVWGVRGLVIKNLKDDTDSAFETIQKVLSREGYIKGGDSVVMLAGLPLFEQNLLNTIRVYKVKG